MNYWAHRGLSYLYPENTLEAFKQAFEYDICGIELDVQLSKDNELVVIHDETLNRTTNMQGYVKDYTLEELKEAEIRYKGEIYRIPTLAEVFSLLRNTLEENETYINIELKNSVIPYTGMEKKVLAMVKAFELEDHIIYSSFNHDSLRLLRALSPKAHLAVLADDVRDCIKTAAQLETNEIHPYIGSLEGFDASGYVVRAWNLADKEPLYPDESEPYHYSYTELHRLGVTDYITNNAQDYVQPILKEDPARKQNALSGKTIDPETGKTMPSDDSSVFYEPIYLNRGTILRPREDIRYRTFFYRANVRPELLHSGLYDEEAIYCTFVPGYYDRSWQRHQFAMKEDGYLRLELQGKENRSFKELFDVMDMPSDRKRKEQFRKEEERVIKKIGLFRKKEDTLFLLASDLHYAYGSISEESLRDMKYLCRKVYPEALIDLGDLSDGLMPKTQTKELVKRIKAAQRRLGIPVYRCLGEHDFNDFHNNPDSFTRNEAEEFYLQSQKEDRYYDRKDFRLIFLSSYDPESDEPFGFSRRTLRWLRYLLFKTPKDKRILLFSHMPPVSDSDYLNETIHNENRLMKILSNHQKRNGQILAYIHGHIHADLVNQKYGFPIIGIASMKPEDYPNKKPEGSFTLQRQIGTVSQELFDIVLIDQKGLRLIRYGAGEDRYIGF
ncbi:MAG: metallophosphoesterase [Erysipelotrichaceae bacterium]|nr:metallophosphoesterase [Erysipelotrichaceae bacterium]